MNTITRRRFLRYMAALGAAGPAMRLAYPGDQDYVFHSITQARIDAGPSPICVSYSPIAAPTANPD